MMTVEIGPDSPTLISPAPRQEPTSINLNVDGLALLPPGAVLGRRYEILQVLGRGGMGAVYKAKDREVNRIVALKVIRPDLAGNTAMLERFKQELVLSHQVTHKNVVRIYDLGEADGVKFITMEFIEGHDLRSIILEKKSFSPPEAVEIMLQVGRALDAVHGVGVIHRDLKPQNIMRDNHGRVVVMDFGLARLVESSGMTQTGALVGTMEYMSPEQALGSQLDHRSDLFTLGLIFYELLSGKMPFAADSALASLIKRTQQPAAPVTQHDKSIPAPLANIVSKCMQRDPKLRYQSCSELLNDLEVWQGKRAAATLGFHASVGPWARTIPWPKIGIAAAVVVLAISGYLLRNKLFTRSTESGPVKGPSSALSVLVADFTNHTGDPVLDGTLEPMVNVALEGASFINAFNRGTARKLASKLPQPTSKLDEQPARLVAISQSINAVITGEISRRGENYVVSAMAMDAASGNVIATSEVTVGNKNQVLSEIPKLVAPLRNSLGDATPASAQLVAAAGAFSAASLEVVHQYGMAMEEQFAGKIPDALASFQKATELDPNFARAYSGMTSAALTLNRLQDAEKYINLAMQHVDHMTDREQFRVRGLYYFATENWQKCDDEYSALVRQFPGDNIAHNNLAVCFSKLRNLAKAAEEARRDYEIHPNAIAAANVSLLTSYASDFPGGEREARHVREAYPSYEFGYLALAFAQLGQGQASQAEDTYRALEKASPLGVILAGWGLSDLASYQGRFSEAAKVLQQGAAADLASKDSDDAAEKLVTLATNQLWLGRRPASISTAEKALANSQSVKVRFLAGRVFAEAGQGSKAEKLAASLSSELRVEPQAYGKIIAGNLALKRGDARGAVQSLTDANKLFDTWIGHLELGRAYLEAKLFVEADAEFSSCLKRQGEALSLFLDQVPTYEYLPLVYYYQGLAREGLNSPGAADSYRIYLNLRGQAGEDPLLADLRKRLGN